MKKIVIIGAGGWGREVAEIFEKMKEDGEKISIEGFIVEKEYASKGEKFGNYNVLGDFEELAGYEKEFYTVVAIGDSQTRKRLTKKAIDLGFNFTNAIHPRAIFTHSTSIGLGNMINAGVVISVDTKICNHVLLNFNVTIGHDSVINDFATLLPGCHVAGNVSIGEEVLIGTGGVVIEKLKIGNGSVLAAGSTLLKNLPENVTAMGLPAKIIFKREQYA